MHVIAYSICVELCMHMQAVEELLYSMKVQRLVIPSVKPLLNMWTRKFGCVRLSAAECAALEERIVSPDPDSAVMVVKSIRWVSNTN